MERVIDALKAMRNPDLWKDMIDNAKNQGMLGRVLDTVTVLANHSTENETAGSKSTAANTKG